ncbi:MAG: DUF819 family protein [Flavobacteriaceae bacterium]
MEHQKSSGIKKVLQWIPPILFAYIIPALVCLVIGVDLSGAEIHQWSKEYIIPLAIVTIMSSMSLKELRLVGIKPIVLFVGGSFIIALLPVVLTLTVQFVSPEIGEKFIEGELWKGLIPLVGSWIGGSTSQLVLKEYVGTSETLFLSVLILDNILVNLWTILMFQLIKQSGKIDSKLGIATENIKTFSLDEVEGKKDGYRTLLIIFLILIAMIIIELPFIGVIVILSLTGLFLGNFFRFWHHQWCLRLGSLSIITVMAILGLKLNFGAFNLPVTFIVVVLTWLILQFIGSLVLAYYLKVSMVWVPISSMANFGGISTAPAVTAAYDPRLMPHAIVLAILSMVTGTFWGIFSTWLLRLTVGI